MRTPDSFRLQGAPNFRDFGGYETQCGKKLVSGKLYRSDALDKLSEEDQQLLVESGLATIIDLRGTHERASQPHKLSAESRSEILSFPIHGDLRTNDTSVLQKIAENPTAEGCYDAMIFAYGEIIERMAEHLPDIFEILLNESSYPVLVHCTAGKDRTGFLCALIHHALNIPEESIYHDYFLTQTYCPPELYQLSLIENLEQKIGVSVAEEDLLPLKMINEDYLRHAFKVVENKYGSIDNYLEEVAGLDSEKRARLFELLIDSSD